MSKKYIIKHEGCGYYAGWYIVDNERYSIWHRKKSDLFYKVKRYSSQSQAQKALETIPLTGHIIPSFIIEIYDEEENK